MTAGEIIAIIVALGALAGSVATAIIQVLNASSARTERREQGKKLDNIAAEQVDTRLHINSLKDELVREGKATATLKERLDPGGAGGDATIADIGPRPAAEPVKVELVQPAHKPVPVKEVKP